MIAFSHTPRPGTDRVNGEVPFATMPDHDPALIIGLSMTYWRAGGHGAVPDLLDRHLEQLAMTNHSAACVRRMMLNANGSLFERAAHLDQQRQPLPRSGLAPCVLEGFGHD